jgi:hypothetical protein
VVIARGEAENRLMSGNPLLQFSNKLPFVIDANEFTVTLTRAENGPLKVWYKSREEMNEACSEWASAGAKSAVYWR